METNRIILCSWRELDAETLFSLPRQSKTYSHTIALFVFRLVILAGGDAIELLEEGGEGGGA